MEQEEVQKSFRKDDYLEILEYSFSDLLRLSKGDKEIFDELYYNRDHEFIDFCDTAKKLYHNGNNILIIGAAGIGKSNYVYRLFYNKNLLAECKLYPIMFDFRTISPNNLDGWKLHFINELEQFFQNIDYKVNLKENTIVNLNDNLYKIQLQFKQISDKKLNKHPILFIDDLDYAEEEQLFELLDFLSPYARNEKVSIILSVRPPLYYAIQQNDFKYHFLFTSNVKKITLAPLHIHNVLTMRLSPLVCMPKKHTLFDRIFNLKSKDSKYQKLLNKLGIENLDTLKEFEYPFTDAFANFMSKVTDGNLREVFDIAIDSLTFILENYDDLESEKEVHFDSTRKILSEKNIVDLFLSNPESKYKLFNLHTEINKKGNSLHYNVLEAVQSFDCSSANGFYESLERMGHNRVNVDNALKELARRKHRFLVSYNFTYAKDNVKEKVKYKITEKGRYYLTEISNWEDYIKACGKSNMSLINKIKNEM